MIPSSLCTLNFSFYLRKCEPDRSFAPSLLLHLLVTFSACWPLVPCRAKGWMLGSLLFSFLFSVIVASQILAALVAPHSSFCFPDAVEFAESIALASFSFTHWYLLDFSASWGHVIFLLENSEGKIVQMWGLTSIHFTEYWPHSFVVVALWFLHVSFFLS